MMSLDEAIKHCEEIVEEHDKIKKIKAVTEYECKCAEEHRQLAGWLMDYKRLLEQTQWIPISERLPEEDGQYLITVKYKPEADYEDIYAEHGEWIDGRWDMFCFGHCGEVEGIVAWMPLPKPYREEVSK